MEIFTSNKNSTYHLKKKEWDLWNKHIIYPMILSNATVFLSNYIIHKHLIYRYQKFPNLRVITNGAAEPASQMHNNTTRFPPDSIHQSFIVTRSQDRNKMTVKLFVRDAMCKQRTGSTLAQLMACCLTTPSHYLNQCWLLIVDVVLYSYQSNFTASAQTTALSYHKEFGNYAFQITATSSDSTHLIRVRKPHNGKPVGAVFGDVDKKTLHVCAAGFGDETKHHLQRHP